MLQRVRIGNVQFPRLYIAENKQDVEVARQAGIPYVKWKWGHEELVKQLLRPAIEKMFPGINWDKVLGYKKQVESNVVIVSGSTVEEPANSNIADVDSEAMLESQLEYDEHVDELHDKIERPDEYSRVVPIADGPRDCTDGVDNPNDYSVSTIDTMRIEDYVGDISSSVNIEVLQQLGMMPKFLGNITDCIRHNVSQSMRWTEGYTKKLGYPLGKFNSKAELPNLIIIDVSQSIPDGIAATMLTLADTLRSQCNAELIITSRRSGYYEAGVELPKPQTLRDYYGRGNERPEFMGILRKHIKGREFGHVFSFGDDDNPGFIEIGQSTLQGMNMIGTKVHAVHHYHTHCYRETGYARWVKECCPDAKQEFDDRWCNVIERSYRFGRED